MDFYIDWAFGLDTAMVCVILFVIFFAGLLVHLRREDKREGYPAEVTTKGGGLKLKPGLLPMPWKKEFRPQNDLRRAETPRREPIREDIHRPEHGRDGRPIRPERDGLMEAVGPAAWQHRADQPDENIEGKAKLIAMSHHDAYYIAPGDPDPRGWEVVGRDGRPVGHVSDLWFNRAEFFLRYLQVSLDDSPTEVLLPIFYTALERRRKRIRVKSLPADRVRTAPQPQHPDQITLREEDRLNAYYAGGYFYGRTAGGPGAA